MAELAIDITCHLCGISDFKQKLKVSNKPEGETDYGIPKEKYYREIYSCNNCGVFFNAREDLIPKDFYEGKYNASIKLGNIERRFSKIITFPYPTSDNKNRVLRIINHLYQNDYPIREMKVLDVGAGTCVFSYEMKKFGLETYCVDPDPSSTEHAQEVVNVKQAYNGTIENIQKGISFDIITFNKVLEHVNDPIAVLKKAKEILNTNGLIYVELPDGTKIDQEGDYFNRSEFYIDHHTIFTKKAYFHLAMSSGFEVQFFDQIIDPSGKHTIYGFLK